ncbi:hypothetical protein ACVJF1_008404 [Bradyrhizobium diazoefficiens]
MIDETIQVAGRPLQVAFLLRRRLWETITIRSVLAKPRRDVRLDLFRGLANWLIFLGHIPNSVLVWFTTRNYGFSDGADLFVLISGYTATFVFGTMMMERGFVIGATRLLRRVWQLYVAHLLLFFVYLTAVHYLAHRFDDLHLMDQFNVAPLMDFPVETLSQGLVLKFKPLNLDVLPLYIVLMAAFPVVLWFMLRWRNAVMISSFGLYLAGPPLRLELARLSGRGLVFQSVYLATALRIRGLAGIGRGDRKSLAAVVPHAPCHERRLSALRACDDTGRANSRAQGLPPRGTRRRLRTERQDQSQPLSGRSSGEPGAHRRLARSDRLAGTEVSFPAAVDSMWPAILARVLRRSLPFVHRAFPA